MKSSLNYLIRVVALVAPVFASSCFDLDPYGAGDHAGDVGSIGLKLTLPSEMQSDALDYTIVGTGTYQKLGKIPFSALTRSFSATIAGIPVGTGYQLQLTSGAEGAKVRCSGSAAFDILMPRVTTQIGVKLQCHVGRDSGPGPGPDPDADAGTGGVDVGGDINLCPEIDDVYTWKEANGTIELSSSACDPDSAPTPLRYKWSVSAGSLSSKNDEVVELTCPEGGGAVEVTLEVSDSLCIEKKVVTVECDCNDDHTPRNARQRDR